MCAKDDLIRRKVLFQTHDRQLAGEPATAESITAKDPNHVNTFSSDFAFSFAAYYRLFADKLVYALSQFFLGNTDYPNIQQSLPDRATVVPIIISVNKTQLSLISGDRLTPSTLLAEFIPTTKIRDPLLKSQVYHYCIGKLLSQNAAKSRILLACADRRIRQCYLTICAILADYEEQVLLTSVKKNRHCTRYTRTEQFTQLQQERCLNKGHDNFHYNFNIYVSLATDTLHLLLKGLVIKMLDFMQDITTLVTQESSSTQLNERFRQVMHSTSLKRFNNKRAFTEAIIQQLMAVVSPLFISKAPFALHFIHAVCDLVTLAQYKRALERMNVFKEEFRVYQRTLGEEKNFNYPKALDSICTRANSEAHHITIVKQFYSMTNKKEYILQICLHNSQRTALLAADYATVVKQSRPSTTVDIQDRTYSTRRSSSKRHNDPKHCDEELYLILTIIDYTRYDKDRKHIAYIRAFSEVLLFNNNRQIDNTTRMLSTLQAFKFYDLSTIICPVHLVLRDLPNLTTRTTMSYYVNNYID
ncbi:hypothetical protein HBI29_162600 [Parastagonospora nodorum]|nr:hypothetical protein HBI29_162600 [Parastagonospora nodorum]